MRCRETRVRPIGHVGRLLAETAAHLALAIGRPCVGGNKTNDDPTIDRHALPHTKLANRLLQQLSDLAATRLLQTLAHRQAELHKLEYDNNSPPPFASRERGSDPSSSNIT